MADNVDKEAGTSQIVMVIVSMRKNLFIILGQWEVCWPSFHRCEKTL
jgi:hypothetical protein